MLNFVITSAISLAALLAVYYLLLQREKMHRFNRVYLLASVIFSMVLPFISIPIYVAAQAINPVAVTQPGLPVMQMPAVPVSAIAEAPQADYAPYVIWGLYGIITLVLLFRFGKNLWRFKVLVAQNETLPHQNATLVLVNDAIVPYTFLNYIFINKEAYTARRIAPELFAHELAHVTQRHTLDILLIEALKTVLWFNPLLYACRHAIQLNHEFLADESALKQSTDIITYQQLLLQHISSKNTFALASSLNFGITKKRFTMMTKTTQKNRALLLKLAALPVLAGLVFALSTKTIAQQPLPKATNGTPLQDSIAYKKKRDAYYSGVKVVIDDQANNVYINKPFEELTEAQKNRFMFSLPEPYTERHLPQAEFDKLYNKKGYYVTIDEKPIDNAILKGKKSKDFVYNIVLVRAKESLTKERPQIFEYHLYTLDYYNKTFKGKELTHYPDSIFKMKIVKQYKNDKVVAAAKLKKFYNVSATTGAKATDAINYTDVDKMPQYPGGIEKFTGLIASGFKAPATTNPDITTYYLTLIIDKDGKLSQAAVLNAEDEGTVLEMVRVLKASENWKPGVLDGKAVRTSYTIPVNLK